LVAIPVLLGLIVFVFFISRMIMSAEEIVLTRLPYRFTEEMYDAEFAKLGLDKPIFVQFLIFMKNLFSGNWGYSTTIIPDSPVWSIIIQRLPRTIEITVVSLLISIYLGIKLGKIGGSNRNNSKDITIRILTYVGVSIPAFILAMLFLQVTQHTGQKIFPFFGYKTPGVGDPPTITYSRIIDCIITGNIYITSLSQFQP